MSDAPADEAGIASAIRAAAEAGEPLLVQGHGTKLGMLRPVQAARSLSTRNLTGITLYSPKELIVSARAGTTVTALEAALHEGGQHLIAEPPDLSALFGSGEGGEQTIGGVVAANLSGPRRVAWGAMRDHVMGVRAVNGAGETIRSGGRVLKNVTGLDLCKLLSGSHGTLAVLTEITLKVLPAPEQTGSLVYAVADAEEGVRILSAGLCSPYGVSGAAYLPAEAADRIPWLVEQGAVALVRIEDFARSVEYRLGRLQAELGGARLDDETSRAAWRAIRDVIPLRTEAGEAIWRVSVRPSRGPAALVAITRAGGRGFLDWGGGLLWAAGPPELHDIVRQAALDGKGTWTVVRAPDGMRAAVEVLPPEPAPLHRITRRVKAAMDPRGVLNPGRMYAGL
ncbi:MAG: FAD-binding protein [Acetobacteraceae bacterium]|nr:FAD-binding protein [Acetobacteraceae bacterium]